MSIITQNSIDEVDLIDHIKKFFTKYQLGKLLKKCNGTKEKAGLWQFANKKIASKPYIYAIYKIKYFVL